MARAFCASRLHGDFWIFHFGGWLSSCSLISLTLPLVFSAPNMKIGRVIRSSPLSPVLATPSVGIMCCASRALRRLPFEEVAACFCDVFACLALMAIGLAGCATSSCMPWPRTAFLAPCFNRVCFPFLGCGRSFSSDDLWRVSSVHPARVVLLWSPCNRL